jgi:hypothetical protein
MRPLIEQMLKTGKAVSLNSAAPSQGKHLGIAKDSSGKAHATDLGASLVPAGTTLHQGLAISQSGQLYVTTQAPAANVQLHQGFAIRKDGALHVNNGTPGGVAFAGLSIDSLGALYESGV